MPPSIGSIRVSPAPGVDDAASFLPVRTTDGAVGFDAFAYRELDRQSKEVKGDLPVTILPGKARLIGIGVVIALPPGFMIDVRPRSGLASKFDVELGNSPGTVDPDFRGEVGVLLRNRGDEPFAVDQGMRIAQLVFVPVVIPDLILVSPDQLPPTRRGEGGFGSTGLMGLGPGTAEHKAEQRRVDEYLMEIAVATSMLSDCVRGCHRNADGTFPRDVRGRLIGQTRRYGSVIARGLKVVATGYNAQYPGAELCAKVGCLRDELHIPSGERTEECRAIHAEGMAILTAARYGSPIEGATMCTTGEPCKMCATLIAGSGLEALVVLEGGYSSGAGLARVEQAGIKIRRIKLPETA